MRTSRVSRRTQTCAAHVFGRHRVIGPLELDIAVAMHGALRFFKDRERPRRQRPQGGFFHLPQRAWPPAGGWCRGCGCRPPCAPTRPGTSFCAARLCKAPALERVVLHILHARFDLPFVPGHCRLGRQDHRAVMAGELLQLGIEFRIVPVRMQHPRLQIVDDHRRRHPAKVPERVFQAPDEALGRLPPHRLAVALARMTQHTTEQMRSAALAVLDHPRPLAEIHLQLLARRTFHAPERQLLRPLPARTNRRTA